MMMVVVSEIGGDCSKGEKGRQEGRVSGPSALGDEREGSRNKRGVVVTCDAHEVGRDFFFHFNVFSVFSSNGSRYSNGPSEKIK